MILGGNNFRFFSTGFLIMVIALFNPVKAQYKKYFLQHFTQINGLPQNSVNQLYFDGNNYLWIATEAGLSRFDGVRFYNFNSVNTSIIRNERFRWILPTSDRKKIIASDAQGSLYEIKNNLVNKINGFERKPGLSFVLGGVPSFIDLSYFKNLANKAMSMWNTFPVRIIPVDQNFFYVVGKKYIYKYKSQKAIDSVSIKNVSIESFFKIKSEIYVQNSKGEIFLINFTRKKIDKCLLKEGKLLDKTLPKIVYKSHLNESYLIHRNFIYRIGSKTDKLLFLELISDQVPDDFEVSGIEMNKRLGILALSSKTDGFYLLRPNYFSNQIITIKGKPPIKSFYALDKLNDSSVITSFQFQFSENSLRKIKIHEKLLNQESILVRGNNIWFGVGDSLFRYDKISKKHFFENKLNNTITCISSFGDSIWIGCQNSINLVINKKIVWKLNLFKNLSSQVQSIAIVTGNKLYFSNCNGLYQISISRNKFQVKNLYPNVCFRDIHNFNKLLFITSYGKGFFVFDGNKFFNLSFDKDNYLLKSHSVQIDKNENIWISTNNGIFQTTFQQVKNFINGSLNKVSYNYYNNENGIQNSEFNGGCYPSSAQLANGKIYFPSINGLVCFSPNEVSFSPHNDNIFFDKFDINGEVIPVGNNIVLKPNSEILNIYFSSPYWHNSYNINYQYMLEGYNSSFVNLVNNSQQISFTNLAAGNYKLIVKKSAGLSGEVAFKELLITVQKSFYETWWFISIVIIFMLLILIKGVKIYHRHLVLQNSVLENKVNKRTKELADINTYLLSANEQLLESERKQNKSINLKRKLIAILSHDIITPLKFISMVARNSKNIKSEIEYKNLLNDIDHTSLRLYENAQNILNWIKYQSSIIKVHKTNVPLYVIVDDAAELLKDLVKNKNSVIINKIDPDFFLFTDKNVLSIVIQNLVSNAVKHNTSVKIEISIESDLENGFTKIVIADNGKGMSSESLLLINEIIEKYSAYKITENSTGSGLGFIIVTELLSLLGASFTVQSDLNGTIISILLK